MGGGCQASDARRRCSYRLHLGLCAELLCALLSRSLVSTKAIGWRIRERLAGDYESDWLEFA